MTSVTYDEVVVKAVFWDKFISVSKYYDIPKKQFDFQKDLEYGLQGESLVNQFLRSISDGDFEVKSDRYRNGRMVVETNQNPRAAKDQDNKPIWVLSGINVTKAKWWVYVYAPEGAFVVIEVSRLKRFLRLNSNKFCEATKIDLGGIENPAKGFLISPDEVMDILYSREYDKKEKS